MFAARRCGAASTTCSIDGVPRRASSDTLLQLHDRAAPVSAICRDQQRALCVVDAIAQRLGAEAAEDDAVRRADAGAREHRDRQLGHERHVDRDAIALLDAERLQHVRERAHLAIQIEIRQRAPIARLTLPDNRRLVAARPCGRDGRGSWSITLSCRRRTTSRVAGCPVEHLRPRRLHSSSAANFAQNAFGIALRFVVR